MSNFDTKFDQLVRAREAKAAALASSTPVKQEQVAAKAPSWVESMGLVNPVAVNVTNLAASVFSGASRVAGDILSLPGDTMAAAYQSELSEEQMAAYGRSTTGQAMPGDLEILNGRVRATDPNSETVLQRVQRIDGLRGQAAGVDKAFDVSSVVDKSKQNNLVNQLGDGFETPWDMVKSGWDGVTGDRKLGGAGDIATGLGQLIYRAGEAAVDNPVAASEFIAENLPQLAVGLAGKVGKAALTTSNVGYGVENYRKGIEKFQAENNGAFPPEDVRQRMALAAAATVAAEQVGDLATLKNIKSLGKAADKELDAARTGFMSSVLNTGKATVAGVASEAATEGFQTFAEGEAQLKPASAADIYTGAAIGGIVGGGLSGGGRALTELAGATPEKAAAAATEQKKSEVFKEAVEKGDATPFTDPASKNYDPRAAISVLQEASRKEGTTPEQKAENFRQAMDVVNQAEDQYEALLAKAPTSTKEKAQLETDQQAQATKIEKLYNQIDAFSQDIKPRAKPEEVQAQVDTANTKGAAPEAIEAVINLSMSSPGSITPAQASALASNTSNGLSTAQRQYLRTLSAAQQAEIALKDGDTVAKEVYFGNPALKQLGIATYKQRFAVALDSGNQGQMNKQIRGLGDFLSSHKAKAALVVKAYEMAKAGRNSDGFQVLRTAAGQWEMRPVPSGMSDSQMVAFSKKLKKNGGLRIHMGSEKLSKNVPAEAKAIELALSELKQAQALKNAPAAPAAQAPAPAPVAAPAAPAPAPVQAPAPSPAAKKEEKIEPAPPAKEVSKTNETPAATSEAQPVEVAAKSREEAKPLEPAGATETKAEAVEEPAAVEDVAPESPTLDIFAESSTDVATAYEKRNLIADFMSQRGERPLVKVKNFLGQLRAGKAKVESFLAKDSVLTDSQKNLLSAFSKFSRAMDSVFQANAFSRAGSGKSTKDGVPYADFRYQNITEFLVKSFKTAGKTQFELEENVRTAMSYAAFSWLDARATLDSANDLDSIRSILGLPDEAEVSILAKQLLSDAGSRANVVTNALGKAAVQALGLKPNKNAPANLMAQLQSTLGAAILKGLLDQGVVTRTTVTAAQFAQMGGKAGNSQADQYFIAPAKDQAGNLHSWIKGVHESTKGTNGFLDKLFGAESLVKWPTLEPVKFTQKLAKNTRQGTPSFLAKILNRGNAQASYVNPDMLRVMMGFMTGDSAHGEMMLDIAGAEDLDQPTHKVNIIARRAKNENLMRELSRFSDFLEGTLGLGTKPVDEIAAQALHFEHEVWKTQRVGIATNGINPQASKVHRHMLFRKAWETQVQLNDVEMVNSFKLRVLEGMGVKTEQKGNAPALAGFEAMFNPLHSSHDSKSKPKAQARQAAIEALQVMLAGGEVDDDMRQDIVAGVKAGGENFQSLSALVAMATYQSSKANGDASFTARLMGEIDGVTNGPMLSHLLLGAASSAGELMPLLNKGGFFSTSDADTQYSEYRSAQGNLDLYETTTSHVLDAVQQSINEKPGRKVTFDAINFFAGELRDKGGKVSKAGRNIIKKPLTAFHFGSSLAAAVDGMAEGFIESIYEKFEELAREDRDPAEAIKRLNDMFWRAPDQDQITKWPTYATTAQLLKRELRPGEIAAIKENFNRMMGKAVKSTFESDFATFIEHRQQLNNAAQLSYSLYNAILKSERARLLDELVQAGKIPVNATTGKPIADLSGEQLVELDKRMAAAVPVMHTEMSKQSGTLGAGMKMAKTAYRLLGGEASPLYSSEARFNTPFGDNNSKTLATQGEELAEESPGVAMVVTAVHSLDSAISHTAAAQGDVLNIHDAHGAGLANFQQTGENLNQATWNAVLNYSPAQEMYAALERTVAGVSALASNMDPAVAQELKLELVTQQLRAEGNRDTSPEDALVDFNLEQYLIGQLSATKGIAYRADLTKLSVLAELQSIDQYALEGGNYPVTDDDRKAAVSLKDALSSEVAESALDAVALLASSVETAAGKKSIKEAVQDMDQRAEEPLDAAEDSSEFDSLFRPVQAMQLLEAAMLDRSLSDTLRDSAQIIREGLWTKAAGTLKASMAMVPREDAAALRAHMREKFYSIPRELWNGLGMPVMQSDVGLVALMEERGELSADQALTWLGQQFAANGQDFNRALARQLRTLVSPELKIRYVTSATAPELLLGKPAGKSRGWYMADGQGSKEIYVMSPEFVYSGLTAEVLLHELTHAALANTIALAQSKTRNAHDRQMVDELEALRALAQTFMQDKPELREFSLAVTDVQELVAWGMTNKTFQEQVLAKIEMPSATKAKVEKRTGAMAFLKALAGLLFRSATKDQESGLAVLLSNVAGLYDTAAKVKSPAEAAINQSQGIPDPMHQIGQWSTSQIFHALANPSAPNQLSDAFSEHLEGLLSEVTGKLHGAFGYFKANLISSQAQTPLDVWQKALNTGEAPFVSELTGKLAMTEQEAFVIEQLEATVRAAVKDKTSHTAIAYGELMKLYREVAEKLKVEDFHNGDWSTATLAEQKAAQEFYDLVFEVRSNADGQSDYLPRFVALGLAHAKFNMILDRASDRYVVRRSDKTFEERLHGFLRRILDWFSRQVTGVQLGESINQSMAKLVGQLVDIEAKKRIKLAMPTGLSKFSVAEQFVADRVKDVKGGVLAVAKSQFVQGSKNGIIQGAGGLARIVVNEQVEMVMGGILKLRDQHFKESQGIAAGLLNYVKGPIQKMQELLREAKRHEKQRKEAITDVSKVVLNAFKDAGVALDDVQKAALTRVFLRTGAHVLLDDFGLAGLDKLLDDPAELLKAIKERQGALADMQFAGYYVMQAKALAYFKVTGQAKSKAVMMNAGNIARLYGSSQVGKVTEAQAAAAEPIIDQLASLYALEYLGQGEKAAAKNLLRDESNRTDGGNGVEMVLKMHRSLENESKQRLFDGSPALMTKGYTPEIYNPHTDVKVARTDAERLSLAEMGYVPAGEVELDPGDPNPTTATLHVLKDGGLAPHLTGTIAYTGTRAKGSKLYGGQGFFDSDDLQNMSQNAGLIATRQAELDQMIANPSLGWDPRKVKGTHMVPVLNAKGNVVAWRYLMQEKTKDVVLDRNNRPEQILGMLAGSIMDKETVTSRNSKVIEALHQLYETEYTSRPDSFVLIAANSPDPEMREIYRLLPDATQDEIRNVWGSSGMRVPYELLDITFGYRKLSLAKAFDKKARAAQAERNGDVVRRQDELNQVEEFLTWFVEHALYSVGKFKGMDHDKATTYSKRGAVVIRRSERMWQELVHEVKDIIVVKSAVVLLGNVKSNVSLLAIHGVPLKAIWEHHRVALRGALDYQRDRAALAQLELKLGSAFPRGDEAKMKREIAILKDAIERNPVKELIDAGLMPTIAEDVAMEDDLYSYKSLLARKTEKFTDKLNPSVVKAGKWVYMTHDTPIYKTLSQITQLSDFVARYTMYQHLINREVKPLSKQAAIAEASEAFVNYDIPMHRSLQYMDDMGFLPFTKYFLSIQRVILKLGREQPARVLASVLLGNYFTGLDLVTESSMVHRVGNNPLDVGALKYPFVIDDLATLRLLK